MKTSDLTLSAIVIFIFMCLYIFNLLIVGYQRIKDNWPVYRCQPLIMPIAGLFGYDAGENFGYCIQAMQKNFMDALLGPLHFNVGILGNITSGLTTDLNTNRSFLGAFRISMSDVFDNIFSTMYNIMIEIQRLVINFKDVIGKLTGVLTVTLNILNGSIMTMDSAWNGPPGGLVRALCFHPDTKLKLQSGAEIKIKDISLISHLHLVYKKSIKYNINNFSERNSGLILE